MGGRQLSEDGRVGERDPLRQGRDVRQPAARRRLAQHRDTYAGSLRYHLGLVVPKSPGECRIFIDGQPYSWRKGEDLVFDETYLHYAENTTSDDRIILFCDVERPLRTRAMTAVNRWVSRHQ
jgi:beta-hydroxylase